MSASCRLSFCRRLIAACFLVVSGGALAQPADLPAPVFRESAPLGLRLEAPFQELLRDRGDDPPYAPASLAYSDDEGETVLPLRVRARGNLRKQPEICRFPPLMLNFPRSQTQGTAFAGENRLKLVTHCQPQRRYRDYLLLEYLSYRALNLLSDYSLKVRLLQVRYLDAGSGREVASSPAFLIEDIDSLAARLGLRVVEEASIERQRYDEAQVVLLSVFQYLLGNTDWSLVLAEDEEECCHNILPVALPDGRLLPVPYDFDVTGLVDPEYGAPPAHLRLRSLRDRLYRGGCPDEGLLAAALARFQAQRATISALFDFEPLSSAARRRARAFIADFYRVLDDPRALRRELGAAC